MARPGPRSSAPGGYGTLRKDGYRDVWDRERKRQRLEHIVVWERAHGPVPAGHEIHHIDGDRLNNNLANLQLVDRLTHRRLHTGCELRDDGWWKTCRVCGETTPIDREHWYIDRRGWVAFGMCRPCRNRACVEEKRTRRQRRTRA